MAARPDPGQPAQGDDSQSFVLRLRIERPFRTLPSAPTPPAGSDPASASAPRLHLRIEHVNAGDISQHSSLESGLSWLAARLSALVRGATAAPGTDGRADPSRRQSPP